MHKERWKGRQVCKASRWVWTETGGMLECSFCHTPFPYKGS